MFFIIASIFTARRVCTVRTMPQHSTARCMSVRPSVRPSVCQSHAGIETKRLHISSKFFNHRVAPPSSFFHTKQDGNIPTGTPNGGVECKGYEKINDFRPISRFISQMMKDRVIVIMEGE